MRHRYRLWHILVLVICGSLTGCPDPGGDSQPRVVPDEGVDFDMAVVPEDAEVGVPQRPDLGVPGTADGPCFEDAPRCGVGLACIDGRCTPAPSGTLDAPCADHLPACEIHLRCVEGICRAHGPDCMDTCDELGAQVCTGELRQICAASAETGCLALAEPVACDFERACANDVCVGPEGTGVRPRVSFTIDHLSLPRPLVDEIAGVLRLWGQEYLSAYRATAGHFPRFSDCGAVPWPELHSHPDVLFEQISAEITRPSQGRNLDLALTYGAHTLGLSGEAGVVVLITGGADECGRGTEALRAVRTLRGFGIYTLVMVVGDPDESDLTELRQLARSGGLDGLSPDAYVPLRTGDDLRQILDAIHVFLGVGCLDLDLDGRGPLCAPGPDCDPLNPDAWTDGVEYCDGLDNDCDGLADENAVDVPPADHLDGVCAGQVKICVRGYWEEPSYRLIDGYQQTRELDCDGLDNDCDGVVDEEIVNGPCLEGIGRCRQLGDRRCHFNEDTQEEEYICDIVPLEPEEEICDEVDNDCDDIVDENLAPGTGTEFCNGIDEDCDGTADEHPDLSPCEGPQNTMGIGCLGARCVPGCAFGWKTWDARNGNPADGCFGEGYSDLSLGNRYTCFLDGEGQLDCRGDAPVFGPVAVPLQDFATGSQRIAVVDRDGQISSWARENAEVMEIPQEGSFTEVAMGVLIGCALDEAGGVHCFGSAAEGMADLGEGHTGVTAGSRHGCALDADGQITCFGNCRDNCVGQTEPPMGRFLTVSAGAYHTCGINENGDVQCWGGGEEACGLDCPSIGLHRGQSAVPQFNDQAIGLATGAYHTCTIHPAYRILCWGDNSDGQLDHPEEGQFVRIWAGTNHTCARRADGWVECWGGDADDQLIGIGH